MTTIIVAKRVKKTNLYDVFLGNGWTHWTRVSFPAMKIEAGEQHDRSTVAKMFHAIKEQIAANDSKKKGNK
jgi:hypothetical protein